jgi:hypothetical protein
MSTFKAAWRRFFWTMSFVAFLALVVYMARDMAHSQPVVFGVIVLSAIVGAVAFVYAIGNKEAMFIAIGHRLSMTSALRWHGSNRPRLRVTSSTRSAGLAMRHPPPARALRN